MRSFVKNCAVVMIVCVVLLGRSVSVFAQAPDTAWTKTFGGAGIDCGFSVQQTTDGGYIVAGLTSSYGAGGGDVYLIKTDSLGDTEWTKTFGGVGGESGSSVQQTTDGGYIVAGCTDSYGAGDGDVYLIKTDSVGDREWWKTFGGAGYQDGGSVQQTTDGGYIIAGCTDSYGAGDCDIYLIKTDSVGDSEWTKTLGGVEAEWGHSVQQTTDGGYIVTGVTMSFGEGPDDVYLIKLEPESGIEERTINGILSISLVTPNPFFNSTTFKYELSKNTNVNISVYNMLGQKVRGLYYGRKSAGVHHISWNGSDNTEKKLPVGIYFLRVKAATRKLILIR